MSRYPVHLHQSAEDITGTDENDPIEMSPPAKAVVPENGVGKTLVDNHRRCRKITVTRNNQLTDEVYPHAAILLRNGFLRRILSSLIQLNNSKFEKQNINKLK